MAVLQSTTITGSLTMNSMAAGFMKVNAQGAVVMDTSTYLTGITSGQVTGALGYTPYNSSNPSGYITANSSVSGWISFSSSTQGTAIIRAVQQDTTSGFYLFQGVTGSTEVFRVDRSGTITTASDSIQLSNGSFRWRHSGDWVYAGNSSGDYGGSMGVAAQKYWSQGDYYFGTRGVWLSAYLNQAVLTTSAPTFSGITLNGSIVNNNDGAVIIESNASENNNWLWKENAKQWGLFWFNRGSQSGQTIGSYTTIGAELMFMGGSSGIPMPTGWTGYIAGSNIAAMISNWNGYIYSASTVFAAGDMRAPQFRFTNSGNSAFMTGDAGWGARIQTDSGYILFGPANGSYAHIYTDRGQFYFNKDILINNVQVVVNSGTWSINITGTAGSLSNMNISQFTNNSGYVTGGSSPTFTEVYADNWFRNNGSNEGLYNQVTTQHLSSNTNGYWDMSSTTSVSSIRFYTGGHMSALRGYVYANTSNEIGFLNSGGSWGLRMDNNYNVQIYGQLTVGSGTSSDIYMTDTDESTRRIHTNSGRIGFLNTSNNWGAYCDNNGNWFSDHSMRAPIFYDSNDTSFYLDPNSYSRLSRVGVGGGANDVSGININGDAGITGSNFIYFGHSNGSLGSWQTRTYATGGRQIWNTNGFEINRTGYSGGVIMYSDSSERIGFATSDFSYTASDNTPIIGSITNNRVFVNGSIQLLGNNDAITFGRGTATFLKDEEIGFGWGGGWYMEEGAYIRSRNGKSLHMNSGSVDYTGSIYINSGPGVHLQGNSSGSYGSLQITQSKNGWSGIYFTASGDHLMANGNEVGHYQYGVGWKYRWYQGTMYVSRGTTGGSTEYTVLDSGNYTGTLDGRYFFDYGFTEGYPGTNANNMPGNRSAFTYSNGAPYTGPIAHFGAAGYGLQLNANYGDGTLLGYRVRNGDNATWGSWRRLVWEGGTWSFSITGNAGTVGGYSVAVGGSANTIPTRNGSGYLIPENWIQLNGIYGLYSPTNNAHLRPNDASYGSWLVTGSRNGWQGIEFNSGGAGNVTMMIHTDSNTSGFHNNSYGWQIRWANGTLYCGKNSYGGNDATVLDSSNYSSWAQPISSAINTGNITSQAVTSLISTHFINQRGSYGSWNADFNNTPAGTMTHGGDLGANGSNGPGGSWWMQQNFRHTNSSNSWGIQVAWGWEDNANRLATRNITGGSFGGWVYYLNSSNFTSWAISRGGDTIDNVINFRTNQGGYLGSLSSAKLQVYSDSNNSAFMSFHKGGHYAVNFGLDADNVMRIGGWSASANRWQLDMSGNMTVAGDVTAYSDARVKENVHTVENALDKTLRMRGVTYNRTDSDDKKTKVGVIAQEMLEVLPEVVNQDNAGMYNVSYGNIVGVLIEAIKEQQQQIEDLKSKLDAFTK